MQRPPRTRPSTARTSRQVPLRRGGCGPNESKQVTSRPCTTPQCVLLNHRRQVLLRHLQAQRDRRANVMRLQHVALQARGHRIREWLPWAGRIARPTTTDRVPVSVRRCSSLPSSLSVRLTCPPACPAARLPACLFVHCLLVQSAEGGATAGAAMRRAWMKNFRHNPDTKVDTLHSS